MQELEIAIKKPVTENMPATTDAMKDMVAQVKAGKVKTPQELMSGLLEAGFSDVAERADQFERDSRDAFTWLVGKMKTIEKKQDEILSILNALGHK